MAKKENKKKTGKDKKDNNDYGAESIRFKGNIPPATRGGPKMLISNIVACP